ncbi:MAG: hypothetical protein ABI461_19705 [Polyangiaceae bacterium]
MKTERRHERSGRAQEAISLFLAAKQKNLALRALTLGTLDGDLLFGVGDDLERVAMRGAKVDIGEESDAEIATWRTHVGDTALVMTSWGGHFSADLADGVKRILA